MKACLSFWIIRLDDRIKEVPTAVEVTAVEVTAVEVTAEAVATEDVETTAVAKQAATQAGKSSNQQEVSKGIDLTQQKHKHR
ncbi:MAG TPA: hypothetical protein V6C97_12975 [Oculatellaceae cyanobacterium]